jgi:tRNA dimethylallyltransferase
MHDMQPVIVICGPTATGKSALAVELAQQYNGEVISADSRQVYTGLDIGSAKITESEMDGIPHHMIDIADPNDYFSVADFQKLATEKITEIHNRNKLPIICGGTGMYIDAVIFGTEFPSVPPNPELRRELEQKTTAELFEQLQNLDPDRAHAIDHHNKVRLIRAIEIAVTPSPDKGRVGVGSLTQKIQPHLNPPLIRGGNYHTLWVGLNLPKEQLQKNIIKRINDRTPALFDEIQNLHNSGLPADKVGVSFERLESFGLEYRYGSHDVQGKIPLDAFTETLATKTWQFAKRQMTWFKRNPEIHWCNPILDKQKILQLVKEFLG